MEYTARIHHEDGTYWAEVPELPGVFASGDSVDELLEGLKEEDLTRLKERYAALADSARSESGSPSCPEGDSPAQHE